MGQSTKLFVLRVESKVMKVVLCLLAMFLLIVAVQAAAPRPKRLHLLQKKANRKPKSRNFCQRYPNEEYIVKCRELKRYFRRIRCYTFQMFFCNKGNEIIDDSFPKDGGTYFSPPVENLL